MLIGSPSINTYGGAKADYSSPIDSTTDRSATGVNPAYGDLAGLGHTKWLAWAHLTLLSSGGTPTIQAHDEVWNNGNNAAPSSARSSAGVFTMTYPTTILDEIPANQEGYIGPQTVNFRGACGGNRGATTWYQLEVVPTAANVLTLYLWKFSGGAPTLADPASNLDVDIFAL